MSGDDTQTTGPPALLQQLAFTGIVCFVVLVIWLGAGATGYFWPAWVWFGLLMLLGFHGAIRLGLLAERGRPRRIAMHATITGVLVFGDLAVWALAGGGRFWPVWPLLAYFLLFMGNLFVWDRVFTPARERVLAERVDVLTETRRGALDVQAAELRRIERDLHDGAQARLVALTMQLGRAEARLQDDPEAAGLVRDARAEASAAIAELRDLARGIAPPVLADRGLEAAAESLGRRAAISVTVDVRLAERPAPVIETAAYFVIAETLTNVAKHAGESEAFVRVARDGDVLTVEVADDGRGGADPDGSGLTGLRQRVEALDGRLTVESSPGGGTTVRAEFPCA
jgi:signal transduction histidine kinase